MDEWMVARLSLLDPARISLLRPWVMVVLGLLTGLAVVAAQRAWRRRRALGALTLVIVVATALTTVAAGVNQHYGYLPTLDSLFGRRAHDEATWKTAVHTAARAKIDPNQGLRPKGMVVLVTIPGTTSHFHARPAQVYLPPAWFRQPRPVLPVLMMLPGTPGSTYDWTRSAEADLISDRFAAKHHGLAPILVMPDPNGSFFADSECVDGAGGRAETYLVDDVPAWVVQHVGSASGAQRWAVAGASAGGTCALHLALRHPDRFATALDFSGERTPTRHGDRLGPYKGTLAHRLQQFAAHDPGHLLTSFRRPERVALWFGVGKSDGKVTRVNRDLAARAKQHGFPTVLDLVPGGHRWRVWNRCFEDALPWTANRLGLTTMP
ncbi:MAG: hypothetical protein JWN46_1019 [Acidimicrobiales bacterium]|nr:hypothetical protein [Acidimicrobiales bacterium]